MRPCAPVLVALLVSAILAPVIVSADGNVPRESQDWRAWSMDDTRQNAKCREHVDWMHMQTVPIRNDLLRRDFVLNKPGGTMHTADVQAIQERVKLIFRDGRRRMIRSSDFERCKRIADETIARIEAFITETRY